MAYQAGLRTVHTLSVAALLAGAACSIARQADAHADDPKVLDRVPRFEGPAFRRAEGKTAEAGLPQFPAVGVTLRSWLPISEFSSASTANDCWGYTSPSGREYAILGLRDGTGFAEVTDPDNTTVIDFEPGPESLWRDVKVYQHYAYAVNEALGAGIQVFDLSDIDNGNVSVVTVVNSGGPTDSHNVAIDEVSGFLYRCGGSGLGMRIYSLANPAAPLFVGEWNDRYIHDLQVVTYETGSLAGRQIAYCCSGLNDGWVDTGVDVLDVTDKNNITTLSQVIYPNGAYSHQCWLSEDRSVLYQNDEVDENGAIGTRTHLFDVSNPGNVTYEGWVENDSTAVGHNLYVKGDLMFQANYRSGLRVFDVSDAMQPEEIAFFDTWESDDNANYNGLWSNYPYFESGVVIGSDIEKGLFVWTIDDTALSIDIPGGAPDQLSPGGDAFDVEITEEEPGNLVAESAMLHIDGQVIPLTPLGGTMYRATTPPFDCGEDVEYYISAETSEGSTINEPITAPANAYTARAIDGEDAAFDDDMETDPGYTVENLNLDDGGWSRGVPVGGGDRGDPAEDYDGSGRCWLTDNVDGNSDVDGGPTILTSPTVDISALNDPRISYARWFTNTVVDTDRLVIELSNDDGASWTLIESVEPSLGWTEVTFRVADIVAPTNQMRVRFSVSDKPNDSVVESAIDALKFIDFICESSIPGDINGDGLVNAGDLLIVLSNWGPCPGCDADLSGNGVVGFEDVLQILTNWSN